VGLSARTPERSRESRLEVIWHDIECGGYTADLGAWRAIADEHIAPPGSAPVLDLGAGTGRVSLDLARHGHHVTAVDLSPALIAELRERARGLPVEAVVGDARAMSLARTDHALCLVPMQTIQLLDEDGRARLLRSARAHLRPGALLCFALVTAPEPFSELAGDEVPTPDSARIDGVMHMSRPVRVAVGPDRMGIERERVIVSPDGGEDVAERDLVVLARLSARALREEGRAAGLRPAGTAAIEPTEEHVGGTVVMLRA